MKERSSNSQHGRTTRQRRRTNDPSQAGPLGRQRRHAPAAPPLPNQPPIGMLDWFRPGEHERVDRVLADLQALGVTHLRTAVSWADWFTPEGEAWYAWLFPQLSRRVSVLPCFVYTPPSWGTAAKTSAPPRELRSYADFIDAMITRFGRHFEWVELWNEPNNTREWDVTLDPHYYKFSEMIGSAAYWARQRGKKTLLGGMNPVDADWLNLMGERGLLPHLDAVGIHGLPGACDSSTATWDGWEPLTKKVREVLDRHSSKAEIWITETGYSTWQLDERRQLTAFVDAIDAPNVQRVYWYAMHDLDPSRPAGDIFHGFHAGDEREYHYGLRRADGGAKLLYRLWAEGGIQAVRDAAWLGKSAYVGEGKRARPALITGGAGFIGTNLAHRLAAAGQPVVVLDNLSRPGVERNAHWLRQTHGDRVQIEVADVRDPYVLRRAVQRASQVYHFAAQVAVTTSLVNAVHDFEVNARGTVNLLEAIRQLDNPPPLVFTSTNKVYGGLPDVAMRLNQPADGSKPTRYEPADDAIRERGIGESRPLDFHSPYGCSKGCADQYVVDYARTFGLPACVFRMSCIYGPHQFGTEDQGWVAHFLIRAHQNQPLTIYGDGLQVRDVLFAEDLVDAFLLAQANMKKVKGEAFNIGGGPANTISLVELLAMIRGLTGRETDVRFGAWRPGDQRYYVSDTAKFHKATGWKPKVGVAEGVRRLYDWLVESAANPPTTMRLTAGATIDRPGTDRDWPGESKKSASVRARVSAGKGGE